MSEIGYIPPLSWLRAFHAAAEQESFSHAAETLGRSQATVSQQIKHLESALGVKLFNRLPRGVELTADGAAYLPHLRSAFNTIATSTRDLFAAPRERSVTLASPVSILGLWLVSRLEALRQAHPAVTLSIATIQRPADYELEDADLEIRYGASEWSGCDKALLLSEVLSPVCTPALLRSVSSWRELPVISITGARTGWSEWCEHANIAPPASPRYRFDSFLPALEAANAGAGLLLASLPLVQDHLADGRLVRISNIALTTSLGHWLIRKRGKTASRESRAVWAWLTGITAPAPE